MLNNTYISFQHCYELSSVENGVATMNLIQTFTLPSCKQRWVSAVTLSTDRKSLICGDRAGTIHVYKWGEQVKQVVYLQYYFQIIIADYSYEINV